MEFNNNIFKIVFFARAGQGAKSIAEVLAQAVIVEGKFVQAFSFYGPQRSGAPTKTYLKISDNPIRSHEPVVNPDVVVVLDDTLVKSENIANNLDKNESLIINTTKTEEVIRKEIHDFEGNIKTIDANMIAMDIIGRNYTNGIILGKLIQVIEIVKLETAMEQFKRIFEKKIGEGLANKNILAIEKGYDSL